jgi:transcriptional regulator with XRE-family HTH domain
MLREEQRMSIRRLAKSAGMSQETLRQLESDPQANPRLDTLLRLQQALGLASLEQLLGGFAKFPTGALAEERHQHDEVSSA